MADIAILDSLTQEEQDYVATLGPKLVVDGSLPLDHPNKRQEVLLTDEEKAQRVLDYRQHKENIAARQAQDAARTAALAKLSAAGDDYAPTVKDLKDLGIL